jgi:hypothetical protein
MTDEVVPSETLVAAHGALVRDVVENMPREHRRFLKTLTYTTGTDQLATDDGQAVVQDGSGSRTSLKLYSLPC